MTGQVVNNGLADPLLGGANHVLAPHRIPDERVGLQGRKNAAFFQRLVELGIVGHGGSAQQVHAVVARGVGFLGDGVGIGRLGGGGEGGQGSRQARQAGEGSAKKRGKKAIVMRKEASSTGGRVPLVLVLTQPRGRALAGRRRRTASGAEGGQRGGPVFFDRELWFAAAPWFGFQALDALRIVSFYPTVDAHVAQVQRRPHIRRGAAGGLEQDHLTPLAKRVIVALFEHLLQNICFGWGQNRSVYAAHTPKVLL